MGPTTWCPGPRHLTSDHLTQLGTTSVSTSVHSVTLLRDGTYVRRDTTLLNVFTDQRSDNDWLSTTR